MPEQAAPTRALTGDRSVGDLPTRRGDRVRRVRIGEVILRRYRVTGELGQGGMGVVYKCFDDVGGIEVALKALPPELSHNTVEMEEVRENFRIIERLHHPNIAAVKTLEKDTESGDYYLILENVDGTDLRRWRKQSGGRADLSRALIVLKQVASALDFAHSQRIIHRDIKPSNVMVASDGTVKVLDFGLAAQMQSSLSRVSQVHYGTSGTGPYMAPEQWRGAYQDGAIDQYALAVVAYELLAGRLPFESQDVVVLKHAVLDNPPERTEGMTDTVWAALNRGLAKSREQRYSSCLAFVGGLEGKPDEAKPEPATAATAFPAAPVPPAGPGAPTAPVAPTVPLAPAGPPTPKRTWLYASVAALLVILGLGGWYFGFRQPARTGPPLAANLTPPALTPATPPTSPITTPSPNAATASAAGPASSAITNPTVAPATTHPSTAPPLESAQAKPTPVEKPQPMPARTPPESEPKTAQSTPARDAAAKGADHELALMKKDAATAAHAAATAAEAQRYAGSLLQRADATFKRAVSQMNNGQFALAEATFSAAEKDYSQAADDSSQAKRLREEVIKKQGSLERLRADATAAQVPDLPSELWQKAEDLWRSASSALAAERYPEAQGALGEAETAYNRARTFAAESTEFAKAKSGYERLLSQGATRDTLSSYGQAKWKALQKLANNADQQRQTQPKTGTQSYQQAMKDLPSALKEAEEHRAVVNQGRQFDQLLDAAQNAMQARDWSQVKRSAQAALGLKPGNNEAQRLLDLGRRNRPLDPGERWTNSLGMVFAPLPGTNALFCIWETRVRDYQPFANGRSGKDRWDVNPELTQNPYLPAVRVTCNDARAFCDWLSSQERSAGQVQRPCSSMEYRLPTDGEWSLAVGLTNETAATPEARQRLGQDVFPWGTAWPRPRDYGNYAGRDLDTFERMAPVGAFSANPNGLYDLGGNVEEWCDTPPKPGSPDRVTRGAGFGRGGKGDLRSCWRDVRNPNERDECLGFRVVLAPVAGK